jgi:hypothetical protein
VTTNAQSHAPIAIFAYDRLDHFERMFGALRACRGFTESPVIIFLDGARSDKDAPRVEAVRSFARNINLPNITLVEREQNMGLKASICAGVSEICAKYGQVIVLEDDLILSPVALEYFNKGLEHYKDYKRVWSIVGYQYDTPALRNLDRALILPFAHCWGWATWERAWIQFDVDASIRDKDLKSKVFRTAFDVYGVQNFSDMLELSLAKKINSWFIRWNYKVFSEQGVSVFPPVTYVTNIGMSSGGTHASSLNPYSLLVNPAPPSETMVKFPEHLFVDYWAIDNIRRAWDVKIQRLIAFLGKIKRLLKG